MKPAGWYVLAVVVVVVLAVVLEAARQERAMRRAKERSSGTRLVRAGLLGLTEVLEPERKVELLREERQEHVLPALPGDPPEPGASSARDPTSAPRS